ncbi:uncharacterized protein BT62DRAFT_932846 [Guyanagaster necrorhizus]|uniref:Uncharacterized protein n=1 Tax=Guyanagaster necrorhizus TaxID=856835 RepID=A0A9P8AS24_9AGAR|nr:uncharacterized protein BT62DRAFT_932846 [Guyanagaster necrorhizus MCA 3950]KAG7445685.1 hypothetical protein BT62DRAFT_932846 [Guyanagaster necrorhizus MCA 3950]
MRPIVSYDDIASTPEPATSPPPAKKRKTNHNRKQRNRNRGRREEESRELTHDEIWDDSALIEAWAAANEEYAAHHGENDKSWKDEPTESPLWCNVPPDDGNDLEPTPEDSKPLNFDTFVPSHDSSLSGFVSQDEALERAMSAMYWAGYWTAVYHHRSRAVQEEEEEVKDEGEAEEDVVEVEEDLVSTQR